MKNIRRLDENYNAGFIHPEIVAGSLEPSVEADTWTRLMPSGNVAALDTANDLIDRT